MKKGIIGILIITCALAFSFYYINDEKTKNNIDNVTKTYEIEKNEISATYYQGNYIDESLTYGNVFYKDIEVVNNNNTDVNYAISMKEVNVSANVSYSVSISKEYDKNYSEIIKYTTITGDTNLAYNLTIEKNNKMYIRITFKANKESDISQVKGVISIVNNLTNKEVFIVDVKTSHSILLDKINSLNGINESGYYVYNVNDNNLKGYVVIDATDISMLNYYYFVSNNDLYVNGNNISSITKQELLSFDSNIINSFNEASVCSKITKKACSSFDTLKKNENGGRDNFYKDVYKVIETVKTKKGNNVVIYDVKSDIDQTSSLRGYILVDYTVSNPVYYLYLTNDLFMVSGYNLTKNGDFKSDSATIRAYNNTAFNLASENMSKVCSFSGYSECYNVNNEKV